MCARLQRSGICLSIGSVASSVTRRVAIWPCDQDIIALHRRIDLWFRGEIEVLLDMIQTKVVVVLNARRLNPFLWKGGVSVEKVQMCSCRARSYGPEEAWKERQSGLAGSGLSEPTREAQGEFRRVYHLAFNDIESRRD